MTSNRLAEESKLKDEPKDNGRFTITEVAGRIGVTTKTIIRWEKAGKIRKPKRDWKGWRVYLQDDLDALERLVNSVYEI